MPADKGCRLNRFNLDEKARVTTLVHIDETALVASMLLHTVQSLVYAYMAHMHWSFSYYITDTVVSIRIRLVSNSTLSRHNQRSPRMGKKSEIHKFSRILKFETNFIFLFIYLYFCILYIFSDFCSMSNQLSIILKLITQPNSLLDFYQQSQILQTSTSTTVQTCVA